MSPMTVALQHFDAEFIRQVAVHMAPIPDEAEPCGCVGCYIERQDAP